VYLFKAGNRILYIGKAKVLKKRVDQYFQRKDQQVIKNLLAEADHIEYIVTDDEKDALHLEYNLVHQYKPPFNIRLKDDKSFPMIEVSVGDPFPGVFYTREKKERHFYVGPITDSRKTKELIDIITRLFKLRTCSAKTFSRGIPCLYYYIERCSAPCNGSVGAEEYGLSTADALLFLKGKKNAILKQLQTRMKALADELKFEEAGKLKEDIQLIGSFKIESYISSIIAGNREYDVIVLHHQQESETMVILFSVMDGRIKKKDFFNFDWVGTDSGEILRDFMVGFYETHNIPHEILVRTLPAEHESLEQMFSQMAGRRVVIKLPLKGNKRKTMDLAVKNMKVYLNKNKFNQVGLQLQEALGLSRFPQRIEGFDISHFSEQDRVGAAVVFIGGTADKKKYRSYIIKKASAGDTEALKEVLERRFKKVEIYPDLLLIDGGKPQLGAALEIKEKLGITSDIIALAKKEERVYLPGGMSVLFPEDSPERFLLQNIRDEVHRRAVSHHRKRRRIRILKK